MTSYPLAFTTPTDAAPWKRWLVFSPLARMVIFIVLLVIASLGSMHLIKLLGWNIQDITAPTYAVGQLLMRALPALVAYVFLVRVVEQRAVTEMAPRKWIPDSLAGIFAGLLLFSAVVGVLWLLGSYQVVGTNPNAAWLPALLIVGLGAGIGEEILFRGALFRIVEEGLGTWWALVISGLFFGLVHYGNPGGTLWSSITIAIEAGLLFGLVYHVSRSLPLCMGLHAAWNFAQGTIYGIPVSGTDADGWLVSTRSGPEWLSGGIFGAEASVVAVVLCTACSMALLIVAKRRGSIVPHRHRRQAL